MTTLTIRIEDDLKNKSFKLAQKLGIPLTLVVKTSLENFIRTKQVTIGEPVEVKVTPAIQKKMDKIGKLLS